MAEMAEPSSTEKDSSADSERASAADLPESDNGELESRHMKLLKAAFEKTSKKCLSAFSLSLLKKRLPSLYAKNPDILKDFHRQIIAQLETNIKAEMEMIFEEENIAELMKKLDDLIQNAEKSPDTEAWRPSGEPLQDVAAHLCEGRRQYLEKLRGALADLESQNRLLQTAVAKQRQQLSSTQNKLKGFCLTWQQAAEVMPASTRGQLEALVLSKTLTTSADVPSSTST